MLVSLLLALGMAQAADARLMRFGDTVETVSRESGVPVRTLRALNDLGPTEQPPVGSLLYLPTRPGRSVVPAALSAIEGEGTAQLGTAPAVPLEVGMDLPAGTRVCIDARSFATIRLAFDPDTYLHDDILLLPSTCLTVTATAGGGGDRSSTVRVHQGSVTIRMSDTVGSVHVLTPTGVATGDRGGFRVTIEEEASRAEALTQEMVVIGAGQELLLGAGFGTRVRTGEAPEPAVALLQSGTPVHPDAGASLRRPEFRWTEVDRALGYRVEFATVPDFTELVLVEEVPTTSWSPDVLFLPFRVSGLWWRITAFDRTGFGGLPSEGRYLALPAEIGP